MAEPKSPKMVTVTALTEIHLGNPKRVIESGKTTQVTIEQAKDLASVGAIAAPTVQAPTED